MPDPLVHRSAIAWEVCFQPTALGRRIKDPEQLGQALAFAVACLALASAPNILKIIVQAQADQALQHAAVMKVANPIVGGVLIFVALLLTSAGSVSPRQFFQAFSYVTFFDLLDAVGSYAAQVLFPLQKDNIVAVLAATTTVWALVALAIILNAGSGIRFVSIVAAYAIVAAVVGLAISLP